MPQTLLICHDIVGRKMAGPGIRYVGLARALSKHVPVTLAIPAGSTFDGAGAGFDIFTFDRQDHQMLKDVVQKHPVCVFSSDLANEFPWLSTAAKYKVIDGYNPLLSEWLFLAQPHPLTHQEHHWDHRMRSLAPQYAVGDYYICASERQRDWWLGLLEASGRVNPRTFGQDASLRKLIDVVAFGIPEAAPIHTRAVVKDRWPGVHAGSRLILWGGGLWPWLDPLTAIRAMPAVLRQIPDAKLIFPGTLHPNPALPTVNTHNAAAKTLAGELGLCDTAVFFGDWVAFEDWPNVLLESSVALSLHLNTIESRLAFRSRIVDGIWAGIPTVATHGDATADLILQHGLGRLVGQADVNGVSDALVALLSRPPETQAFEIARNALAWSQVANPLIRYCQEPWHAADRAAGLLPPATKDRAQLEAALAQALTTIRGYENGRFMRLMRWLRTR